MTDDHKWPSKELDGQKGGDLSDILLPCPFCGGKDNVFLSHKDDLGHYVACICGAGTYYEEKEPKKAIKAWNTRTNSNVYGGIEADIDIFADEIALFEHGSRGTLESHIKRALLGSGLAKQLTATQQALDEAISIIETLPTECYNAGVAAGRSKDKAEHCIDKNTKQIYLERMAFWQDKFKELHKAALKGKLNL